MAGWSMIAIMSQPVFPDQISQPKPPSRRFRGRKRFKLAIPGMASRPPFGQCGAKSSAATNLIS
jgi:hypothetical protein